MSGARKAIAASILGVAFTFSAGAALLSFTGQKIQFMPFRGSPGDDSATVRTVITQPGAPPVSVDYNLHLDQNNQWKVYDISIEGVSLAMANRSQINSAIYGAGSIDAMIDQLEG